MKGVLQTGLWILAAAVVITAIGMTVEWFRKRGIRDWAKQQGGSFESGTLLEGLPVPEAAPFDFPGVKVVYSNVSRFSRPEAAYVVSQYQTMWKTTKDEWQSFSCVVCFITLPGPPWPPVKIQEPDPNLLAGILGRPAEQAAPIPVPDVTAAFSEALEVRPMSGGDTVAPESLARLLPKAVQEELVAQRGLITQVQVRGNTVRLQAVSQFAGFPHREVFEVAKRLGAAWAGP